MGENGENILHGTSDKKETPLGVFQCNLLTLSDTDLQKTWIDFLKKRQFHDTYVQSGKELLVENAALLLQHMHYGLDLKNRPIQLSPDFLALLDFVMSASIQPGTRNMIKIFGAEVLRRRVAFEAREGIKGVKQLLEDQNYQQLEQKEKELIQCAPFDARGKMDLTERILKVKNSFLKKDITSTLEALRELETLFISINMDYNESAQKNTGFIFTSEGYVRGCIRRLFPDNEASLEYGCFIDFGTGGRMIQKIEHSKKFTILKHNSINVLFDGIVRAPQDYTVGFFRDKNTNTQGLHRAHPKTGHRHIFINEFSLFGSPHDTTIVNEFAHEVVSSCLDRKNWNKLDMTVLSHHIGLTEAYTVTPQQYDELISDIASILMDMDYFYEHYFTQSKNKNLKNDGVRGGYGGYNLCRKVIRIVLKSVFGEKYETVVQQLRKGKKLSGAEEVAIQKLYLKIGRTILFEIAGQLKIPPPKK